VLDANVEKSIFNDTVCFCFVDYLLFVVNNKYRHTTMAYLIGAYQYFDDSFLQSASDYYKPNDGKSNDDILTNYWETHHPKWLWILRKAKRESYFQKDSGHKYTIFLPDESTFTETDLMNFDIQYCLHLFNTHVIHGHIDNPVLNSSAFQQLSTLEYGEFLFVKDGNRVNEDWRITKSGIQIGNVTIHIIKYMKE
jgi:uncharacterized surface protein with fasciclin (FAS1) repeats